MFRGFGFRGLEFRGLGFRVRLIVYRAGLLSFGFPIGVLYCNVLKGLLGLSGFDAGFRFEVSGLGSSVEGL